MSDQEKLKEIGTAASTGIVHKIVLGIYGR
jgi:hypothetical protein